MRIGLFSDAYLPDINGVVSSVATLKAALEKLGHVVFVISNHKGVNVDYDEENHILRLPGIEWKKLYGYKMSSPIQIFGENYVRDMKLDVIHVHTEWGIGIFARQTARKFHIPVVYTYHTMYEDYMHYINPKNLDPIDRYGKKAIRYLSKRAGNGPQAVIAPSNKTKKALESYGVLTPIYIVPTGLDLSDFLTKNLDQEKVKNVRSSVGLSDEDHVVVFVGRIAKEKAIEMPIEAVSLVKDKKLHLVIVGGGTDMKYYQNKAKEFKVEDKVHFTGKIDKQEIPYYYSAFDCFVSASLSETQGMTYIEALASGLMIFGRRDEVLDDLIEEGKTGYYFDDAQELAKKWDTFFQLSEQERNQTRSDCVAKTEVYDTELFAQKVLAVYQQAIDDYQLAYMVEHINFVDDFVQLTIRRKRSNAESTKIMIPEEDFFDLKISKNTMLDSYTVENYLAMQDFYKALRMVKRKVIAQDYTALEIRKHCIYRMNLDEETTDAILLALQQSRLIDDHRYALEKASAWQSYGLSKRQISNRLYRKGVKQDWIDEALSTLPEDVELDNALKVAKQLSKTIKMQSNRLMRQNLIKKLINKGYSMDIAKQVGESIELENDEVEALHQTIRKASRLYTDRLDDKVRLQKIRLYCMRKGFTSSQIDEVLESDLNADS